MRSTSTLPDASQLAAVQNENKSKQKTKTEPTSDDWVCAVPLTCTHWRQVGRNQGCCGVDGDGRGTEVEASQSRCFMCGLGSNQ